MAGSLTSNRVVTVQTLRLPEFHRSRSIPNHDFRVFHTSCRYDMIIGRDLLSIFGIDLDFNTQTMTIDGAVVVMRPFPSIPQHDPHHPTVAEMLLYELAEPDLWNDETPLSDDDPPTAHKSASADEPEHDVFATAIKTNDYAKTDLQSVVSSCTHLSQIQQNELHELLLKHEELFQGKLGHYPHPIHLDIDRTIPPQQTRPFSIPHSQLHVFKTELDRLVKIGVLEPCGRAEWISGTFIIPKKDGKARWISDFRALNKALKRKVYHLPLISDVLSRRSGYKFLTKIDLAVFYYSFELDDESADLCTIATPFGMYRYQRLAMGLAPAPDIAQETIERILAGIEDTEKYIDDVACFSDSWHSHLQLLDKVLGRLRENGLSVVPSKCEWAVQETDFLGHWLTPTGLKPWRKKVNFILRLSRPTNIKELRSFLGMVNYYRDMWPCRSHILQPLTDLTGTRQFKWSDKCETAFKQMKALVATDALLAYPNHNLPFDIEADASDYQLGSVIKQNGRPVAYYSRKLKSAQHNYTTIEKELLSIVETFREF